ncbi:MAG: MerR family transcriptional regulator [Parachlamydiaceae bacterium]
MMAENVYFTKEVADKLGVGTSTVRKYSLLLEEHGYEIDRNDKDQRAFYDADIALMQRIIDLVQSKGMTLSSAAKSAIIEFNDGKFRTSKTPKQDVEVAELREQLNEMTEYLKQQERFNRELISRLEDRREQDQLLLETREHREEELERKLSEVMKELRETKEMIAAAKEEPDNAQKGFFARLFGK